MNKKKWFKLIVIAISMSALNSCTSRNTNQATDDFYTSKKEDDLYRIPLIDPIELLSPDEENWFFEPTFPGLNNKDRIGNIDSICMLSFEIILYSQRAYRDSEMGEIWYIVNMKERIITMISNETSLKQKMNAHSLPLQFTSSKDAYKRFKTNGSLLTDD